MEVCRKMQGDRIISALIGLVGAVSNNGKTERTDSVVREAFLRLTDGDSEEETVQKIHAEKFAIAPDCATCLNPCGNTSDCDMSQFYTADVKIIAENQLTAMMVTHNMKDAIVHGNRLIMMHEGKVIYDVAGEEKKNLQVKDLLAKFEEVSGGEFANDRMMLA